MNMNFWAKTLVTGLGAACVLGGLCASSAQAQTTITALPVNKPFRLSIGAAFPTDIDNSLSVGGVYEFGKSTATAPLIGGIYADYYGKSSQNVLGIGLQARHLFSTATSPSQFYAGAGLGAYVNKVKGSSNKTNFGGKILAGYQLNSGPFAEVDYTLSQENNNVSPNALNARIGYRF